MVGHTRSWRGQRDSCLDHVWTDTPESIISPKNVVSVNIRLKGQEQPNQVQMRRNKKNFSIDRYKEKLKNLDWNEYYQIKNVDRACTWLESNIQVVLDSEGPLETVQTNKKLKSWISADTADIF